MRCLWRIPLLQALQKSDELTAAMTGLNVGDNFARVKVTHCHNQQRTMTNILVIAPNTDMLARYWRQIRCARAQRLHPGLLIHAHGIDRLYPRIVHRLGTVDVHIPIDHQHLDHFTVKLSIAPLQVVAHPVRLQFMGIQDAPHRGLAGPGEPRETAFLRMCSDISDPRRERPQLGGQPHLFRLTARQTTTHALAASLI